MTFAKHIAKESEIDEVMVIPEVAVSTSAIVDDRRDIDDDLDMLDEASVAMEDLLSIYRVCHRSSQRGMSEHSAQLMLISTEHICSQLGISLKQELPALEHFGSVHTTSQATTITVETIGETISRIFTAFIEMMKNVITKIFEFIRNIWDVAEQKRTEQYQRVIKEEIDRLKKRDGKKDDEAVYITNQRLITAFSDPEKGINDESVKRILRNAEDYCEFLISAAEPVSKYLNEMISSLKEFNNEIGKQNFATFVFGEKIDDRVAIFLQTQFNPEFEQSFDKHTKTKETFDTNLIKETAATDIDGNVRASGLLVNGIRFAYYHKKSSYAMACEQTQHQYEYSSSDDTIYKLPELELANEVNKIMISLSTSMAKLSAIISQKHSRMESEIKKLMSSVLAGVNQAEKKIDPATYDTLYITVKVAMHILNDVFTFYRNSYGAGLMAIKTTSDCGNMLSKEIVTRYQDMARNQDK